MIKGSLKKSICTIVVMAAVSACQDDDIGTSQIKYLQQGDIGCHDYGAERLSEMAALPQGFFTGYQGESLKVATNRLAGIPNRDMDHLVWTFQQQKFRGISASAFLFGAAGLTTLSIGTTQSGFVGSVGTSVTTLADQPGFALQHEIGHAVQIVAREAAQKTAYADFDGALAALQGELIAAGGTVRGYAQSSPAESWAEAYANYYCSEESRRFIESNFPTSYKFLSAVLEPPPYETNAAPTTQVAATVGDSSSVSDPWFVNLIAYISSAIMPDLASVDFTKPLFSNLPGINSTINMALTELSGDPTVTVMVFASDIKITQIFLCFADEFACSTRNTLAESDKAHVLTMEDEIAGRNFFPPHYVRAEETKYLERGFFALGYDASGKLLGIRELIVSKK